MEIARVECDNKRCRAPMNGSGYYLSHETVIGGIRMAIIKSEHNPPGDWQNHYCGKACLMLALNEFVEEIAISSPPILGGDKGVVSEIQPPRPYTPLIPPLVRGELKRGQGGVLEEEEDHEDNLGI